jgi:hypothetical protein
MGAFVVLLKSHLRRYPPLVRAYAKLLDFVRSMKPPAWKVHKDASGQFVCDNGHIQTAIDAVANVDQRGRAYTSRACPRRTRQRAPLGGSGERRKSRPGGSHCGVVN